MVPFLSAPIRLQEYGVGIFQYCPTKSALKKVLKKQYITVDKRIASTATYINGGECIELFLPETINGSTRKLIFPLKIVWEDEHLALIHKPAGILVSGNSFKTIAHALVQNLKKSDLPDATRPQPIHRLDYATTGILLTGKTTGSIRALYKMFEEKEVEKVYYAITIGSMASHGEITSEIDEKNAHTLFTVRATVPSKRFSRLNLVELRPRTGRTHQLRRHMLSIGNPILGDKDYAHEGFILNGKGLYLHAYSLKFTHPISGVVMYHTDELPERFTKIFPPTV